MKDRYKPECERCHNSMLFYPGCCGNLPLWRCPVCGTVKKWTEEKTESDRYFKLK